MHTQQNTPQPTTSCPSPVLTGEVSRSDGGGLSDSSSSPLPTAHCPLPPLTEPLFEDLLDPAMTPILICQIHDLTLKQLTTIIHSDDYQSAITAIQTINAARLPIIKSQTHLQAISTLKEAADLAHQAAGSIFLPLPRGEGRGEGLSSSHSSYSSHLRAQTNAIESLRKSTTTLLKAVHPQSPPQPPTPLHWAPKNSASSTQCATLRHSAAAPPSRATRHTNHDPKSHRPTPGALTRRLRRSEVLFIYAADPDCVQKGESGHPAGELMPQKSTFFYPKLGTGFWLNPLG